MVNPLWNPKNSLSLLKTYLFAPNRIKRLNSRQMKKFKDKSLKRLVKYAYKVPMYHDLYKKAGVHPTDIKGIEDIVKLPLVSKDDIRNNYPDKLLPNDYTAKKAFVISTGGTSGKSVSIYVDFYTMINIIGQGIREFRALNFNLINMRRAHIGNFNENRIDLEGTRHFYNYLEPLIPSHKLLNVDVSNPMKKIIKQLDVFRPDLILSYPAVFQHLAYLKRKGYGKNLKPKVLQCGGAMLDEYTRNYVQDAFNCRLLNTYQSVEALGTIAFECMYGTWHVNHDFYHLETIDEDGNPVDEGERGHLVFTRLWGTATPIIRYTGMEDWVRIVRKKDCKCGLSTPVIEGGVEGRKRANIILPDGRIFPPGAFCFIEPILSKHNSFQIKQYQIIQREIDYIEILIVVDEDLRDKGVSIYQIKEEILENYRKKVGPKVEIVIKEVDEIKHPKDASKPAPIVVSHVKSDKAYDILNNKK